MYRACCSCASSQWSRFDTRSRGSLAGYAISHSNRRWIAFHNGRVVAWLVGGLRLCVLNGALFENRWWRFSANHETGFADWMRVNIIMFDISPSPKCCSYFFSAILMLIMKWWCVSSYLKGRCTDVCSLRRLIGMIESKRERSRAYGRVAK